MTVKAICTHCGAKQTATEINYSLNYVACKKCHKEGELREVKVTAPIQKPTRSQKLNMEI